MESKPLCKNNYISFDWDLFDTSSSRSEDSKTSYGFSFSDLSSDEHYDPTAMYGRIQKEKLMGNSYSSTTTRAVTKASDETETVVTKKKTRRRKRGKGKKEDTLQNKLQTETVNEDESKETE